MEKQQEKITIKQIVWYFVFFSILGLILETIFCYVTTGVLESRKGLIWGPFCPVYGVGATLLILILKLYEKKIVPLFVLGCILGNVIEYVLSYGLEAMYGTRFWDYAYLPYNLNGRICFLYSIYWGVLAILLMKVVKKIFDQIIEKIPNHIVIHCLIIGFLAIDTLATVWGIKAYQERIAIEYGEKIENEDNLKTKIENQLFSNEKMVKTFPNLRYIDENGREYYIRDIIKEDKN